MEQTPGGILLAIPAEIRNSIYQLLLASNEPIPVRTPRQRTFRGMLILPLFRRVCSSSYPTIPDVLWELLAKQELSFSNTSSSILYVNKKIHDEAIKIFFQYNTFVVGNGTEENEASLIGLKALTKYVPASLIGAISKLQFHVYLRTIDDLSQLPPRRRPWETEWTTLITPSAEVAEVLAQYEFLNSEPIPFRSGVNLSMGGPAEALEIRQIHRCIPKHFVNVTTVTVDWVVSSNKVQIWPGRIIPREATITVLSKAIKSLMQLPKLRQICMWEDECVYTEGIIERLLAEQGEMGKAIQFEHLRYNEGISGRIRREAEEQREIHLLWIA